MNTGKVDRIARATVGLILVLIAFFYLSRSSSGYTLDYWRRSAINGSHWSLSSLLSIIIHSTSPQKMICDSCK